MSKKGTKSEHTIQIPKPIIYTGKLLQSISPKLATLYAARLFTTPIKFNVPKREILMLKESKREKLFIEDLKKTITTYHYGTSIKKVLLVHGWSGRGTQLVKIAEAMVNLDYQTVSFDAPAHGTSTGSTTIMTEFITSIHYIDKKYGPFEYAIGHSLGGMSILNALRENFNVKKAVIIGSGDIIQDIIDDFVWRMNLNSKVGIHMKNHFEKKYNQKMEYYASSVAAKNITTPVLIVHDENDPDVHVKAAINIHENLRNSELILTNGLGHNKILGDKLIIQKICDFIMK
jgi:pimeloyl-ACP methyl ester carboxylesterase